ncbi:DUF6691 family protein [Ligilactobacillus sp. LYQ135]
MILLAIPLGMFFGFSLYYVGATNSSKIIDMLRLKDLSLAKIILGAIGVGSLTIGVIGLLNLFPTSHFEIKPLNIGVLLGGLVFGIGFGLVGSCPGTAMASLFTNFKHAIWVILGGITGALTFSNSYSYMKELGLVSKFNFGKLTLFDISSKSFSLSHLGISGLIIWGAILIIIAIIIPKTLSQIKNKN